MEKVIFAGMNNNTFNSIIKRLPFSIRSSGTSAKKRLSPVLQTKEIASIEIVTL
jgi:hypothetical protein